MTQILILRIIFKYLKLFKWRTTLACLCAVPPGDVLIKKKKFPSFQIYNKRKIGELSLLIDFNYHKKIIGSYKIDLIVNKVIISLKKVKLI